MPVCLPQLDRREFLKRAALAGLAATLTPSLFAQLAAKPRDLDTVFLLSDAHIPADPATTWHGVDMTAHFTAVVQELLAWPVAPAAVVLSGDLAFHAATPGDYAAFEKLFTPIRALAPVHLLLGNHDHRETFWQSFPLDTTKDAAVPAKQVGIFTAARHNWFLLDSLETTNQRPGLLGPDQQQWLARELDARPDRPAIVVCHHHLDPIVEVASLGGTFKVNGLLRHLGALGGLKDTPPMEKLLARHRQVKAYIYGHTHDWHVSRHEHGVELVNLPPTAYVFEAGRPSGWVRATFSDTGAELELLSLDPKHYQHGQIKKLTWRTA